MGGSLCIGHTAFVAQGHIADIGIEMMRVRIAIPVGFIGTNRMFVPLAGKYALPANGFKPVPDPADTGKEIDKTEGIVRMCR
jgi:hypothetical protein